MFGLFFNRARQEYWQKLNPSSGRPFSSSMSKPDCWGITAGDSMLIQHTDSTTDSEMKQVFTKAEA